MLKSMPQGMGTFPDIEIFILKLYFFDIFRAFSPAWLVCDLQAINVLKMAPSLSSWVLL